MKRRDFKVVDDFASGDFVFDAFGETLEELFAACARACFFAIADIEKVRPVISHSLKITGETTDDLLYNFIAELIYLKDAEKILFSEFEIEIAGDGKSLNAIAQGERINHDRHRLKTDVKAVTYHGLGIRKDVRGYATRMVLDL